MIRLASPGHGGWAARVCWCCLLLPLASSACGGTLDAGADEPRGPLPVDDRNPIVILNDGADDNWQGEYAALLANTGGPPLAGIVIDDSWNWPDLDENLAGWQQLVAAAREGGLKNIPDPIASEGPVLERPSDGDIESTVPNRSAGAQFIIDAAERFSQPSRPLVIVTGGRLTDVADAYLMDPAIVDEVVVVSSLGTVRDDGAEMGVPNGNLDTWADIIVAQRFRYVQVSEFYYQKRDVPEERLAELPTNAFASWIRSKQPDVWGDWVAADQVAVLAVAIPEFVSSVERVVQEGEGPEGFAALSSDPDGPAWLVTEIDETMAASRLWEMLLDPATLPEE